MNATLINVLVAAAVGFGRSAAGYLAVIKKEEFDLFKFLTGALIGTAGGIFAGLLANDFKMAIIGALTADDIRSVGMNAIKKG